MAIGTIAIKTKPSYSKSAMQAVAHPICGHGRQLLFLEKLHRRGMPASALLFFGPERVGKKTIALGFAAGLFCNGKKQAGTLACLDCQNCKRVMSGIHPDFLIFYGDEEIGIAQIHELRRRLALHAYEGSYRGVLIDNAHLLTADAQGALLKTLEEPPEKSIFLLVTQHPRLLLDTIRSRMLELSFGFVAEEAMKQWAAENFPSAKVDEMLFEIAAGRPGMLKEFLENPNAFKEAKTRLARFAPILGRPLADQFLFSEKLVDEDDEQVREFLGFIIAGVRAKLLGQDHGQKELVRKLRSLLEFYFQFETTNVNKRLLVDSAMLEARHISIPHITKI